MLNAKLSSLLRGKDSSWYYKDLDEYKKLYLQRFHRELHYEEYPQLNDKTQVTDFDAHYTYQGPWVMRKLIGARPDSHVDVGSWTAYLGFFSSLQPTVFVDIRPAKLQIPGLTVKEGSVLSLPFKDKSVQSISCLHVVEHVGLGRYGDPINPSGTIEALNELERVVAPGGNLYLSVPTGIEKTYFNAHRVLSPKTIISTLSSLNLVSLSGVLDDGSYHEKISVNKISMQNYSCGLYHFCRKA